MSDLQTYTLSFACDYAQWSRYDLYMMAACYDEQGERIECVSLRSRGRDAEAAQAPRRDAVLTTPAAASVELYLYIVPNTLPGEPLIVHTPPFAAALRVRRGEGPVREIPLSVNQWGGLSLKVAL